MLRSKRFRQRANGAHLAQSAFRVEETWVVPPGLRSVCYSTPRLSAGLSWIAPLGLRSGQALWDLICIVYERVDGRGRLPPLPTGYGPGKNAKLFRWNRYGHGGTDRA